MRTLAILLVAAAALAAPARADVTLWYNGNYDGRDSQTNSQLSSTNYSYVYDDFVVPVGQSWTINRVWSNDQMTNPGITTRAFWEIRQGVSSGNGGTVVAGGVIGTATQVATGRSDVYPEYTVQVAGLNVSLQAGTYFLTVAPLVPNGTAAYIDTTSGSGAVGTPPGNNGNSFAFSPPSAGNLNWVPTSSLGLNGSAPWDFSEGVAGSFTGAGVPEPSVLTLSGLLGAGALAVARYRRRRPAAA